MGRRVQCPGCNVPYRLTPEVLLPEDRQAYESESTQKPASSTTPIERQQPDLFAESKSRSAPEDRYDLDEPIEAPKRSAKPIPDLFPDRRKSAVEVDEPEKRGLSTPILVGGGISVAVISILVTWLALRSPSTPAPDQAQTAASTDATPVAAPALDEAPAPSVNVGDATQNDLAATTPAGGGSVNLAKGSVEPKPGMISVAVASQVTDSNGPAAAPAPVQVVEPQPQPNVAANVPAVAAAEPKPEADADGGTAAVPQGDAKVAGKAADSAAHPERESDVAAKARAAAASIASSDAGPGKALSTAEIVEESEPSVAVIKGSASSGTGFLAAPGLLVTNSHVIDDEMISQLEVRFVSADDKHSAPIHAELLYEDPQRDLAFLAVKTDLKPLRIAKTYNFRKGEDITVIGSPGLGDGQVLENAISRGVMSTKTQIEGKSFYQLGIAINPGNSGGPVFDSSGRVIGVVTLKSMKQESTGFSIPIEDLQDALGKVAKQSAVDSERYRSKHRSLATVKTLGVGGALMCLVIDLRRLSAVANSNELKELLVVLEAATAELNKEVFPSATSQAARIKTDPLVPKSVRDMVGAMNENFARIWTAYLNRGNVDSNQLRPWKQTHKRLIIDLANALKLPVPTQMLVAFEDYTVPQQTIIALAPQNLGSFNSRVRPRIGGSLSSRQPGSSLRQPSSIRDRMRQRSGRR